MSAQINRARRLEIDKLEWEFLALCKKHKWNPKMIPIVQHLIWLSPLKQKNISDGLAPDFTSKKTNQTQQKDYPLQSVHTIYLK